MASPEALGWIGNFEAFTGAVDACGLGALDPKIDDAMSFTSLLYRGKSLAGLGAPLTAFHRPCWSACYIPTQVSLFHRSNISDNNRLDDMHNMLDMNAVSVIDHQQCIDTCSRLYLDPTASQSGSTSEGLFLEILHPRQSVVHTSNQVERKTKAPELKIDFLSSRPPLILAACFGFRDPLFVACPWW